MPHIYFLYQGGYVPHAMLGVGVDGKITNGNWKVNGFWTYHQVHLETVVELQGRNIVGLLKVVNHQQFSVLETPCALEKLLQTFLKQKAEKQFLSGSFSTKQTKR